VGWLEPEAAAGAAGSSDPPQQFPMAGASGGREFPGGGWGARIERGGREGREGMAGRECLASAWIVPSLFAQITETWAGVPTR
jgi:hypothetical protein